ncbi:MAG: hypothetical protein M3Z08_03215 [Chloroflexota bacterium]|nr:hypothetical protein [Chloroflexota bacterium]
MEETGWSGMGGDMEEEEARIILGGRYRLVRLLHRRPRLRLYLARRLSAARGRVQYDEEQAPLVVIRELDLSGLAPHIVAQVERAAFEEFVSPMVLGSPRLPGAGDRVRIEGERHYMVMQLRGARGPQHALAVSLADLLLGQHWPDWLTMETTLAWGIQLCRIVAKLHRMGAMLGDLDPATVLVDVECTAEWAPVLLISWPPPPQFWPVVPSLPPAKERCNRIFPAPCLVADNVFAAPEMLSGIYSERSDVYSLGALVYMLLTRYAPAAVVRRQAAVLREGGRVPQESANLVPGDEELDLIAPHLLNEHIPLALEYIVLRALALNPMERYPSVFALVEALEGVDIRQASITSAARRMSRAGRALDWLKRELTS